MTVEELLDSLRKTRHIFCYGAGLWGRIFCVFLREHGISIDGLVISSGQAYGEKVLGKPVHSFGHLPCPREECTFILSVAEKTQPEIVGNLRDGGVSQYYPLRREMVEAMRRGNS